MRYMAAGWVPALVICFVMAGCRPADHSGHAHGSGEAEEEHEEAVELTERQMQTVGIELGGFSMMALGETVSAAGELMVAPRNMADVTPLMGGVITDIRVREGDFVRAGETVARIESMEGGSLVQDYRGAVATFRLAENEYERQKKLADHGAGIGKNLERARIEYESAKTAVEGCRKQMTMAGIDPGQAESSNKISLTVKAPISGTVAKVYGRIGGEAGGAQPILSIVDNTGVFAMVKIYERDLGKIKVGMPVDISLTNGSGLLHGRVEDVIPVIDPVSKTIDVRVALLEDDKRNLLPGMAVNAYIGSAERETAVLPEDAVVSLEGKDCIYVLAGEEDHEGEKRLVFLPVEVVKGHARNGFVEVNPVGELPEAAKIVVAKAFYLASMAADHGEHNH